MKSVVLASALLHAPHARVYDGAAAEPNLASPALAPAVLAPAANSELPPLAPSEIAAPARPRPLVSRPLPVRVLDQAARLGAGDWFVFGLMGLFAAAAAWGVSLGEAMLAGLALFALGGVALNIKNAGYFRELRLREQLRQKKQQRDYFDELVSWHGETLKAAGAVTVYAYPVEDGNPAGAWEIGAYFMAGEEPKSPLPDTLAGVPVRRKPWEQLWQDQRRDDVLSKHYGRGY